MPIENCTGCLEEADESEAVLGEMEYGNPNGGNTPVSFTPEA